MSRQLANCLGLCLALVPLVGFGREPLMGSLSNYVAEPDDSYAWTKRSEGSVLTCKYVELMLTSQTWRGIPWKHQLFLLKPAQVDPTPSTPC